VGVYLCWGFGLTWAVAWGVAWTAAAEFELRLQRVIEDDHQPTRVTNIYSGFGMTQVLTVDPWLEIRQTLGESWFDKRCELPWFAEHIVPYSTYIPATGPYFVAAYGWPLRALAFEVWTESIPTNLHRGRFGFDENLYGALVVPGGRLRGAGRFSGPDLWLPLLPLWRGLVANVLFYALVVLVLRRGFVLLRGRRRRRRGRCWAGGGCGYDLTGLHAATCPECGRQVAPTKSPQRQRRVGPGKGAG